MIVNVPTRICNTLRDRAKHLVEMGDDGKYRKGSKLYEDAVKNVHRGLVEAWSEGVMHAWTIQNIEETKRR